MFAGLIFIRFVAGNIVLMVNVGYSVTVLLISIADTRFITLCDFMNVHIII